MNLQCTACKRVHCLDFFTILVSCFRVFGCLVFGQASLVFSRSSSERYARKKKRNKCWVLSMVASLYRKHELYAKVIATLQSDEVLSLEGVHVCNPRCPRNVDCADVGLECERMKSHR